KDRYEARGGMFSIICVFNDEKTLKLNLLTSLNLQEKAFDLILVDNQTSSPLTKALNEAALKAKGEFLMFVHQDVKLIGGDWLEKAERFLGSLKGIGATVILRASCISREIWRIDEIFSRYACNDSITKD
ncbi:MAG: glycosyltransferase family A protein, partial [Candidatus Bathyarchaeia archaeon]